MNCPYFLGHTQLKIAVVLIFFKLERKQLPQKLETERRRFL
jgi:hypothetical protein